MTEEGIGQEFRLKNKKARYYFIKETDQMNWWVVRAKRLVWL